MSEYFDYKLEPGKKLEKYEYEIDENVEISIIIPYYNSKKYIKQTMYSVLNQTYPNFEVLIVNDGSTEKGTAETLEEIKKIDKRIKIINKKNEGVAVARDFGVKLSNTNSRYLMFLDSDDLLEKTFLECAYWTLETNKKASWAYSDSVAFGGQEFLWQKWFDSEEMKKTNNLLATSMIRKKDFLECGGYELKEKNVYEDWNLWLKMIKKGKFPVHMSFNGIWYRKKIGEGEFSSSQNNKERAMHIIKQSANQIFDRVEAIQYPRYKYDYDLIEDFENVKIPIKKDNAKINILFIVPWLVVGGADNFNLDLIKRLDKDRFSVTVITTEPSIDVLKQEFEKYCLVYSLPSFLDIKNWSGFVHYLIKKENINLIFNTNSSFGYSMLPYIKAKFPKIPIIDYVHMEEWYYRNGGYARYSGMYKSVIDKTLTCNKSTQNVIKKYYDKKEDEIDTVYIGVDEKKFNPEKYDKEKILKKYNLDTNGKFVLTYLCRITEQKRPFLFFEIIKELTKMRRDLLVLVVGDGNLLNELQCKVEEEKLEDIIKFLGKSNNTEEIYKISDITLNCSIKEGLALTSYESLSMGVPVISSNVGGQSELINDEVGKIVPCIQDEKDILKFKYNKKEVELYVKAVNQILKDLDRYKENCRKRIIDGFTIDWMISNMTETFENAVVHPSKEKIENGYGLSKNIDITKELISSNIISEKDKYKWQVAEYEKSIYGKVCSNIIYKSSNLAYKKQRAREIMWKFPPWRFVVIGTKKVFKMPI